ncbi:hypothetical protein [Candidatus Enterococcus huntleyi]|uniref:hypothetical protein n=1 Tax=Candidatus Enterococcus huntleyi TaxID=1857217 RepID=UPI001F15CC79|nr:hypothetical protein [Enterococcus sp. JM4C]
MKKSRIYRKKACGVYLSIVRRKKKSLRLLRPKIRKLLNFLKRDIRIIKEFWKASYLLNEQEKHQ